ncbi:hypothetical protein [Polaromonas jejuensis]|uniref:DUF2726 domain-containing protein n=1 Tax=Polaromonas jejuensis TaxID=457502 RepID=A0ABW0Q932_9BURK|nr:hypothetical protein [Polaromonas jejuensis]
MNLMTLLMTVLGVSIGVLAGALLNAWWLRRKAREKLLIPPRWPLAARGVVTTDEHLVWHWLRDTFYDHIVMVKIPVQRFTLPIERERGPDSSERWLDLLNGVYTTFTVCNTDGKVVGCVDVPTKRGFSRANRELKETLLSDCAIAYTVVRSDRLPAGSAMRAAFLGEIPAAPVQTVQEACVGVDTSFYAEIDAFTRQKMKAAREAALKELNRDNQEAVPPAKNRNVGFNPDGTGTIRDLDKPDPFAKPWEDSFIYPADTRPARLE